MVDGPPDGVDSCRLAVAASVLIANVHCRLLGSKERIVLQRSITEHLALLIRLVRVFDH
jgi:hypothetical protein